MLRLGFACICSQLLLLSCVWGDPGQQSAKGQATASRRVPWTQSRITGSPVPRPSYQLKRVFPRLKFKQPVVLTTAPGVDRWFVAELDGAIRSFPQNKRSTDQSDLFIDVSQQIPGATRVYGLTFHPRFQQNHYAYICYITEANAPRGTRVSRFLVSQTNGVPRCDAASEQVLIEWKSGGHNGGCLKFGPDGYLYITTGDASSPSPPDSLATGQDLTDLLASVLRIDVDHGSQDTAYRVPADNPFVAQANVRPEIWAYGFRNPWKMSFDAESGQLWVGDVGWEMWEMIYRIERGGNYGWSIVEGPQSVKPESPRGPTPILPPAAAHSHIESRSITGGFVYRGSRLPELSGHYVYGDYVTGKIWSLRHDRPGTKPRDLADSTTQIIAFGEDAQRELVIVGYDGTLYELEPDPSPAANSAFPQRLSQTGLFQDVGAHRPAAGVIAYTINAEPWADGAVTQRMLGIPTSPEALQSGPLPPLAIEGAQNPQQGRIRGEWSFPPESVLVKTLSLPSGPKPGQLRRIETQILHRDRDTWRGYTYAWNEQQTDAALVSVSGLDKTVAVFDAAASGQQREQTWHFPSRNECIICHTTRAGSILGFNAAQLNRPKSPPNTQTNQLQALINAAYLADPRQGNPQVQLPRFANPHDTSQDLETRARSYLHVNCAHCHRRGGGGTATFVLLHNLPLEKLLLVDQRPTQGTFNIHGAQVIASGDPFRSVLYYRMATIGRGRMPHIGSAEVDRQGEDLLFQWIQQMPRPESKPAPSTTARTQRESLAQLRQHKQADRAINHLLASTSGSLRLMRSIADHELDAATTRQVLSRASAKAPAEIRGLFERFRPHSRRVRRLGGSVNPQDILARTGNAAEGEQLFHKASGVQCRNCHRIGQTGKQIGPDLTTIGKKQDRAKILDSILNPSRQIETKYLNYIVETTNGLVLSGLLEKQSKDQVVLKDNTGKLQTISRKNVELLVPQRTSMMPDLLLRDFTAQQVADLIDYLLSLK